MYRGFNLKLTDALDNGITHKELLKILDNEYFQDLENDIYLEKGKDLFNEHKKQIITDLGKFTLPNKSLDGSEIQNNWFPTIKADIFLSHSHKNEALALRLAGWLYERYKLKTFVDSAIWGNSNELLKKIDNEYSWTDFDKKSTYSYEKRNLSTSHVHLMLLMAINKMINNCECIIFLNTPNSISSKDTIDKTSSPWIYSEIELTRTIKPQIPIRFYLQEISKGLTLEDRSTNKTPIIKLDIEYPVNSTHLTDLSIEILKNLKKIRMKIKALMF